MRIKLVVFDIFLNTSFIYQDYLLKFKFENVIE